MTEKEQAELLLKLIEQYKRPPTFDWFGATMFAAVVGVMLFLVVGVWVTAK